MTKFSRFRVDYHVHSCLSPCGETDSSPKRLVARAIEIGLDMMGLTDHNSAENAGATIRAAAGTGLTVIPGMEVTTAEEIHVVGLFGELGAALELQEEVYEKLTPGKNDEDFFGMQVVADEFDNVLGFNDRLLLGATSLSLEECVKLIHRLGGLAIASHIDREAFSLVNQLGFVPDGVDFDAFEITSPERIPEMLPFLPAGGEGTHFTVSSDAHSLDSLGSRVMAALMEKADFGELSKAVRGIDGRGVEIR